MWNGIILHFVGVHRKTDQPAKRTSQKMAKNKIHLKFVTENFVTRKKMPQFETGRNSGTKQKLASRMHLMYEEGEKTPLNFTREKNEYSIAYNTKSVCIVTQSTVSAVVVAEVRSDNAIGLHYMCVDMCMRIWLWMSACVFASHLFGYFHFISFCVTTSLCERSLRIEHLFDFISGCVVLLFYSSFFSSLSLVRWKWLLLHRISVGRCTLVLVKYTK